MLCLAGAISVWGDEIMPTLVTRRAQKGLRPTIGFVSEDEPRSPMVVFGAFGAAHFAFMSWVFGFNVVWFQPGCQHSRFADEMGSALAAMPTNKEECFMPSLVDTPPDLPLLFELAFFARVVWPLKGFFCHETMPILR